MTVIHYEGSPHHEGIVLVGHNTHVGTTPDEVFALVNQIHTLFDEGYITHEQCCLALGLTGAPMCQAEHVTDIQAITIAGNPNPGDTDE
jgi:hypothetical protein